MRNLYQVLGTPSDADDSQLKSAFRNLAKALHPDLNAGDKRAEERFKEINRAYEVLRDPKERAAYDVVLADQRTRARRRFRNAAVTMFATFALSAATCLPFVIWLQAGGIRLAPTNSVTLARSAPAGGTSDDPSRMGEEPAMPDSSPRDKASPGGIGQSRLPGVHGNPAEWADTTSVSRLDDAVSATMHGSDAKELRAAVDPAAKPHSSDAARSVRREAIAVVQKAEAPAAGKSKVSTPSPPAQRWPTADEPFFAK